MRGGRISISVACAVALLRVTATLPAQPLASVREAYQPLERELSELKIAIDQKFSVVLSPPIHGKFGDPRWKFSRVLGVINR